ncbi:hypothetical protein HBH64_102870 [Parastagonospora nodorum]|nr:hypothetical protein HBI01_113970 [Parastagonospora nodorum]KAH4318891.1 hypothetical protein HBI02_004190 [Parastagonospora nodorum]KAH4327837.1 hypothetical protein HBI00_126060 [Parastagonospora nodorum]KAH4370449.1 hypothetical protein HBH94_126280 [Parastagonospora nodorum]KAH4461085.1 hypothetical protein HBH90_138900 [Parastagonospora nodorum]
MDKSNSLIPVRALRHTRQTHAPTRPSFTTNTRTPQCRQIHSTHSCLIGQRAQHASMDLTHYPSDVATPGRATPRRAAGNVAAVSTSHDAKFAVWCADYAGFLGARRVG